MLYPCVIQFLCRLQCETGPIYLHFKGHLQFLGCTEWQPFKHISFYSFVVQLPITGTANIQLNAPLILHHPSQYTLS